MATTLIVLCPGGRRMTIQTSPTATLMSILEEVCAKRGEANPLRYELHHHGKFLDLSNNVRFSGLPNRAQLELVETKEYREPSEVLVRVVIQTEDGKRLPELTDVSVNSSILECLSVAGIQVRQDSGIPVCLYMRSEISGIENFEKRSLRSLGITTSSRVLIRFFYKDVPGKPNVEGASPHYPGSSKNKMEASEGASRPPKQVKSDNSFFQKALNTIRGTGDSSKPEDGFKKPDPPKTEPSFMEKVENVFQGAWIKTAPSTSSSAQQQPEPILHYLDDNNTILAYDSDNVPRSGEFADLDEDFFRLGVKDLELLQRSNSRAAQELQEGGLLMGSKMRLAQEEAKKLQKLNKYKRSVIRIQFPPPKRFVLQIVCLSGSKIEEVKELVKRYLKDPTEDFSLFVTPPKKILDPEKNLLDLDLVPATHVYISFSKKSSNNGLCKEVLGKLSNYIAADGACRMTKRRKEDDIVTAEGQETARDVADVPSSDISPQRSQKQPLCSTSKEDGIVPNWFKKGKQ